MKVKKRKIAEYSVVCVNNELSAEDSCRPGSFLANGLGLRIRPSPGSVVVEFHHFLVDKSCLVY